MKYDIIQSGSDGNCIIVNKILMLDCGVAYSKIKDKLNDVRVIFISHGHFDHIKPSTIKKVAYEKPNIKFLVGYYLVSSLLSFGVDKKNILVLDLDKWYNIGIFKAKMQYLFHDVPNNCLHVEFKNGCKLFYAVDTSSIDHIEAKEYDLYLIEGNYETEEEIQSKIAEAKKEGKFTYLDRVQETHLSQVQALNWLYENRGANSECCFVHVHKEKEENCEEH